MKLFSACFFSIMFFLSLSGGEYLFRTDFQKKPSPGGEFDLIRWRQFGEVRITENGVETLPSKNKGWSDFSTKTGIENLPSPDQGTLIVSWSMIPNADDSHVCHKGSASRFILGNAFTVDLCGGYTPRLNNEIIMKKRVKLGTVCKMSVELNSKHILSWKVNGTECLKKPCPLFRGDNCHVITLRDFSAHNIRTVWLSCSMEKGTRVEKVTLQECWDKLAVPEHDSRAGFMVTAVSSMTKVFREPAAFSGPITHEVQLTAAGREKESFQAVIIPLAENISGLKIKISNLERDGDGKLFPAEKINWNPVGYIRTKNSNSSISKPGWLWPDVLLPREELKVTKGYLQPIWFTVNVPADCPAGIYRGVIDFSADGLPAEKLLLKLKVFPFSLPLRGKMKTAFGLNPGALELWYHPEETRKLAGMEEKVNLYLLLSSQETKKLISKEKWLALYDMLLEHRVNPLNLYHPPVNGVTRPIPEKEDFKYCFDRGLNAVCLGGIEWIDPNQKKYFEDLEKYLKTWEKLALSPEGKEIVWFLHCLDEAASSGPEIQKRKDREFKLIHEFLASKFPWIKLETPNPYMGKHEKNVDIWVPHNMHFAGDPKLYDKVVKEHPGNVWGYVSNVSLYPLSALFLDYPGTDPRVLSWQFFQQGLSGFLYWNLLDIKCQPNWESGPRWPSVPWQPVGVGGEARQIPFERL